jgi:hypothetical protein
MLAVRRHEPREEMMPNEKKPHLFTHDYGGGSIWFYVLCRSPDEVTDRYRDVVFKESFPSWATEDFERSLPTYDIEKRPQALKDLEKHAR